MKIAIYNTISGMIRQHMVLPPSMADIQCREGEDFYLNCPSSATHIINNEPVTIIPERTITDLLTAIRNQRNRLLRECDWTQLQDAPVNRGLWQAYRQQLRDFPASCDPHNPVWPIAPEAL
jgi:hypothetical protein